MSQNEIVQYMKENYNYDKEARKITIKNKEYFLHITKTNFEFHEERKEENIEYIRQIIIKQDINVEVIRSFNFKEITSQDLLKECVESILNAI